MQCDLYDTPFDNRHYALEFELACQHYATEVEKEKLIKHFSESFELVLPKGTEFVCYVDNGVESWYDNIGYGMEDMSKNWAERWLEDIQPYKKEK